MSNSGEGKIVPVILSGGSGTRLWPLSRKALPKQFWSLKSEKTLIQETALRAAGVDFAAPIVITNEDHRFIVAEQLRSAGLSNSVIILEPAGRNTAPAAAVAAFQVMQSDPDAYLLLMPADHIITDDAAFQAAVAVAKSAATEGALVTLGITPTAPETGYGYIKRAAPFAAVEGAYAVERFVEKPDRARAEQYLASGDYLWNSGIFLFRAKDYLAELTRLEPAMFQACKSAAEHAAKDADFVRLEKRAFESSPANSIDYAVMEKAQKVAVVPVEMGWNDIGSWHSLWEASSRDADGNAFRGDVVSESTRNSYIHSEGPMIAMVGVEDLVVVATKDAVLVSRRDASQDVKKIVDQLETGGREQHKLHPLVHRPWGTYETIDLAENFQVKRITVKPGAKLSLQMHHHRAEHWIVVSGTAIVTCDDSEFELKANQSTYIPLGSKHRLENRGPEPLRLIEVQSGNYLGEDDIVRFEDTYGRVPNAAA